MISYGPSFVPEASNIQPAIIFPSKDLEWISGYPGRIYRPGKPETMYQRA